MLHLEYTVVTRANRELVWEVFSNWSLWHRFSDVYGEMRWEGTPWEPGSRLKIELVRPVRTIADHVITGCSPAESVAWIDHVYGNTMEQQVRFQSLPDGGTQVHTWADFLGPTTTLGNREVSDILLDFVRGWYDRFAAECDRLATEHVSSPALVRTNGD
jgi:hypothetical protein